MKPKIYMSPDKLYVIADTQTFQYIAISVMEQIRDEFLELKTPMDHLILGFECYVDVLVLDGA